MTDRPGFLEFFILEASDYVEQLDGLLLGGGSAGPDGDTVQRIARALRGTATMAKLPTFAELAGSVERIGRAIHDGVLPWEPALGGAMIAAVDDLKTLLHAARRWSTVEDRRATARTQELARFAPMHPRASGRTGGTPAVGITSSSFLATEAANIAAGLELLTTRSGDPDTASNVLRRVRALRGVAGVKEVTPLAMTLEATEDAGRGLESPGHELTAEARALLEASATYLRALSSALRTGGDIHTVASDARDTFDAANEAWAAHGAARERVIPIAELFYADGDAGLIEASEHPPTTAAERFRIELVSLGEHLKQVVDASRTARDTAAITRARRELRRALDAMEAAADSFGEREIADFVRAHAQSSYNIDFLGLSALEDLASIMSDPGAHGERLRARAREITAGQEAATAIGAGFGHETPLATPVVPSRAEQPAAEIESPSAVPSRATAALGSMSLLDSSIAALEMLAATPMLTPADIAEDDDTALVPIESLLYRGRAALDRALEVRDSLRGARGGPASNPDALDELFDLLELARAE